MNMDESKQPLREYCGDVNGTCISSLKEVTLIETVTSFLEENGAAEVDRKVLRKLAEALSKSIDRTCPSVIQDVTMENSCMRRAGSSTGSISPPQLRSSSSSSYDDASFDVHRPPGGNQSPLILQGRSVRELEEQISALRKENFNLKLRIYFLEESQPGGKSNSPGGESLTKQLIDTKIEVELLRKTVDEKTELLKDAARAISRHEEIQKKSDIESQALIEQLQQHIRLQVEEQSDQKENMVNMDIRKFKRLESEVHKLEAQLLEADLHFTDSKGKIEEMEKALVERQDALVTCEAKIEELAIKNAELLEQIDRSSGTSSLATQTIRSQKNELGSCLNENQRLVNALANIENELLYQHKSMKDATETMDAQRRAIELMEGTIQQKDMAYSRLLGRLIEYEGLITKLNAEVDLMRQENQIIRDDVNQKDQMMRQQRLERELAEQTIRNVDGVGNSYCSTERSASNSSLHSNFSSISLLHGSLDSSSPEDESKSMAPPPPPTHVYVPQLQVSNQMQMQLQEQKRNRPQTNRNLGAELADKICELQDAQEKLLERERIHEQACRTIQKLMQKLSSQDKEIVRLQKSKEQASVTTKNEDKKSSSAIEGTPSSLRRSLSDTETCSMDISHSLKERLELKIAEQEETITNLQTEVKKKTANLQNLVNKELWEKNREIERLTQLVAAATQQSVSGVDSVQGVDNDQQQQQQSFSESEYIKAIERNKLLQLKVDVLIQRLGESQQSSVLVAKLEQELIAARADVESSNKWRLECADVCGVLTNRLEELAGFLNSLLKHKDVLGVLAADRRHAIRRAVDRSLDLSKSLNMTLSITGVSLADQSLSQLCNLSELLDTEGADPCNHTYNSHEEIHAASSLTPNTIENLKAENKALKRELEKEKRRSTNDVQGRKERRSLPLPHQLMDNQSESEAWSEPDRKVSLARIGLEETSSREMQKQQISESESDGPSCSSRHERNKMNGERIIQLEEQIAQRDERILSVQCQLVDLDNLYKQEQLRCMEISQQLEQLQKINEALTGDLRAIGTQEDQALLELQRLVDLKTQQIDQLQLAQSTLTADAQVTEMELQAVQQQIVQMQKQQAEADNLAQDQLNKCRMESEQKLEQLQRRHQEALERDWVALAIYQEQTQQLLELQRSLDYHQENEKELKQTLVENELASRSLKKQLDESTLQASKAVMERTKAYNDKMQLEKNMEELKSQLKALKEGQEQQKKNARSHSSDVSQSGYTSEEVPLSLALPSVSAVVAQRLNNSSPDLGIESDAGRGSIVELSNAQRALLKTVEFKLEQANQKTKDEQTSSEDKATVADNSAVPIQTTHDCAKVDQENAELRRKLIRTKRAFEDTYEKLRLANKAKAQVEKDIKNQILKTHNVLRNVRSNMENELI